MKREFPFFRNVFLNATKNSYERATEISTKVDAALEGPDRVPALYTMYHPLHQSLTTAYIAWISQGGNQKGSTATLADLFKGLRAAVADWDYQIQGVYYKGSPEYIRLFPRGRAPFTTGKQVMRIAAVGQLRENIGTDPLLASVKTQIDGYFTNLTTTNSTQKNQKSQTDARSQALETARVAACEGLYSVMASLMVQFKDDPAKIKRFFPMDLIRRTPQTDYTGRIAPGSIRGVARRKLVPDDTLNMKNPGLVSYTAYLAETRGGPIPPGTTPLTVPSGANMQVTASQLGNVAHPYLTIQNTSEVADGDFNIAYTS